jgi:hypothetical protein
MILTQLSFRVGPRRIEVAERYPTLAIDVPVPVQQALYHALGFAIRIHRFLYLVLGNRDLPRNSVGRTGGREDDCAYLVPASYRAASMCSLYYYGSRDPEIAWTHRHWQSRQSGAQLRCGIVQICFRPHCMLPKSASIRGPHFTASLCPLCRSSITTGRKPAWVRYFAAWLPI